ncbi:MAG TPA: transcriptional regulator [Terracidiphilus sp.]
MTSTTARSSEALWAELWTSLGSLLRSYTAAHGLHLKREAAFELTEEKILVRHGKKWLRLIRNQAILTWTRENGSMGTLELTESGTLRSATHEEAMDLAAESWAREIMQ